MRPVSTEVPSLNHLFLARVDATPLEAAYLFPTKGGWDRISWGQLHHRVRRISAGLRTLGVEAGAVLASTRLEWLIADFALLLAGVPTTTIYPSSTPATIRFIVEDAEVGVVFVEDAEQLAKLREDWPAGLAHAVLIDGEDADPRVLSWAQLGARGEAWLERHGAEHWREEALTTGPEDLATLIYTSGTTGTPKGVRLVHDNWVAQAHNVDLLVGRYADPGDMLYLWLPLAHAYGKVLQLAGLATGATTVLDGDHHRIPQVLRETSPAWVPAVPRVFEKMRNRVLEQAATRGPRAEQVARWALEVGVRVGRARLEGRPLGMRDRLAHRVADRLVFSKVRANTGGRIKGFISGSAPLAADLEALFEGMGLPIIQGYGLTECAAVATANLPDVKRAGTVGRPMGPMEVRVVDGEVQLKGRAVMRGYHNRPDATDAVFDGAWFRTGDLGAIEDGFVKITGRAKEILITAGGKNIAPAPIESAVKARCGLLQEVVLIGDARPTCMALITLDPEALEARGLHREDPQVRAAVEAAVNEANEGLASFETIKGFAILPRPFTIEGGELTASQKVKRAVVTERYADVIEQLYG